MLLGRIRNSTTKSQQEMGGIGISTCGRWLLRIEGFKEAVMINPGMVRAYAID